jgi:hypothetical protein
MVASRVFKSGQNEKLFSFKTAACLVLSLVCGLTNAATTTSTTSTTSTVVLISPVSVMTSIAGIAPVITTSGGWITIRLSVPQLRQLSGPVSGPKEEAMGKSTDVLDAIEAEKPNLDPADLVVSDEGSDRSIPLDIKALGLKGQPVVFLNLSNANAKSDAVGVRTVVNPDKPNGYKLTVGFN